VMGLILEGPSPTPVYTFTGTCSIRTKNRVNSGHARNDP
jgi:hypothetical protein